MPEQMKKVLKWDISLFIGNVILFFFFHWFLEGVKERKTERNIDGRETHRLIVFRTGLDQSRTRAQALAGGGTCN